MSTTNNLKLMPPTQNLQKQSVTTIQKELPKPILDEVPLQKKIQLKIPQPVLEKVKYLCSEISDLEWSGILMYELVGNFAKGEFYCQIKDIYPMNVGSAAYTEYEFDAAFIKYRMADMSRLDMDLGHVHSHNKMSTFFSSTDTSELKDNVENHNYYLSLIVNNAMEMTAKIAFKGTMKSSEKQTITFKDNEGRNKSFNTSKTVEKEVMFTYTCNIEVEKLFDVEESFKSRVNVIIEDKRTKDAELAKRRVVSPISNVTGHYPIRMGNGYGGYDDFEDYSAYRGDYGEYYEKGFQQPKYRSKDAELEDDVVESIVADFLCLEYDCKKNVGEAIFLANIDYKTRGSEFITEVGQFFRNMFPMYGSNRDEPNEKDMEDILTTLYFYGEEEFPELTEELAVEVLNEVK